MLCQNPPQNFSASIQQGSGGTENSWWILAEHVALTTSSSTIVVLTENWEWVLSLEYTQSTFIRNDVSIQTLSVLIQRRSHECNLLFQNQKTILSVSIKHGSGFTWIVRALD